MAREEKRSLVASLKKPRFHSLKNWYKTIECENFAEAISTKFLLKKFYILRYPRQRWIFSENLFQWKLFNLKKCLSDVINISKNMSEFKCLIIACKAHPVVTKMTKGKKKLVVVQLTCRLWTRKVQHWFMLCQILCSEIW